MLICAYFAMLSICRMMNLEDLAPAKAEGDLESHCQVLCTVTCRAEMQQQQAIVISTNCTPLSRIEQLYSSGIARMWEQQRSHVLHRNMIMCTQSALHIITILSPVNSAESSSV
eukprot:scpid112429/ scgid33092/ 